MDLKDKQALANYVESHLGGSRSVILMKAGAWLVGAVGMAGLWAVRGPIVIGGIGALGGQLLTGALIAVAVILGGMRIRDWAGADPRRSPVVAALRQDPSRVVWFYAVDHFRGGAQAGSDVWICLDDGRAEVVSHCARDAMLEGLHTVCPRATSGFSDALKDRFTSDPASLRMA